MIKLLAICMSTLVLTTQSMHKTNIKRPSSYNAKTPAAKRVKNNSQLIWEDDLLEELKKDTTYEQNTYTFIYNQLVSQKKPSKQILREIQTAINLKDRLRLQAYTHYLNDNQLDYSADYEDLYFRFYCHKILHSFYKTENNEPLATINNNVGHVVFLILRNMQQKTLKTKIKALKNLEPTCFETCLYELIDNVTNKGDIFEIFVYHEYLLNNEIDYEAISTTPELLKCRMLSHQKINFSLEKHYNNLPTKMHTILADFIAKKLVEKNK